MAENEGLLIDKIGKEWDSLVVMYQKRSPLWLINNADEVHKKHLIAETFMYYIDEMGLDDEDVNGLLKMNDVINTVYIVGSCQNLDSSSAIRNSIINSLGVLV